MILVPVLLMAVAPPAPPGATMVPVESVHATFTALGREGDFSASRKQSISSVFSSYTGVATDDIFTTVTASETLDRVDILVDHSIPSGTAGSSIASTLNNGIMRSVEILQAALQSTGGTIVESINGVAIDERYVAVYPPPAPGPAFSDTIIIVIVAGGVLGLIALIFIARNCDAEKLKATTNLATGVLSRLRGGGGEAEKEKPTIKVVMQADTPNPKATEEADPPKREGGLLSSALSKGKDVLSSIFSEDDETPTKKSARVGANQ